MINFIFWYLIIGLILSAGIAFSSGENVKTSEMLAFAILYPIVFIMLIITALDRNNPKHW